jgi:hypothetical protein
MATKVFVLEGPVALQYMCCGENDRKIFLDNEQLEQTIAKELNFPNDDEFEEMMARDQQLGAAGLAVAEGEPDIVREGVNLRVTIEVL